MNILFAVRNGKLFFAAHENSMPEVSDFHCIRHLSGVLDVPDTADLTKEVARIARQYGWVGRVYDADSEVGQAMLGKREFKMFDASKDAA